MEGNRFYKEQIGKRYSFKIGDKVPRWLFESDVAFFGRNVVIEPKENMVEIWYQGSLAQADNIIYVFNKNGKPFHQVCPTIHFHTTGNELSQI